MNQDQLKEKISPLLEEWDVPDYQMIYSGKASKRVAGLYKPKSMEIIIHNKSAKNENDIILTAIHELAHHIHFTKYTKPKKPHDKVFKSLYGSLLKKAIDKGIYQDPFGLGGALVDAAQIIIAKDQEYAAFGKDLGKELLNFLELCQEHGADFDDFSERCLGKSKTETQRLMGLYVRRIDTSLGHSNSIKLAGTKNRKEREALQSQLAEGNNYPPIPPVPSEDSKEQNKNADLGRLEKERTKIEKSIAELKNKLKGVELMINDLQKNKSSPAAKVI